MGTVGAALEGPPRLTGLGAVEWRCAGAGALELPCLLSIATGGLGDDGPWEPAVVLESSRSSFAARRSLRDGRSRVRFGEEGGCCAACCTACCAGWVGGGGVCSTGVDGALGDGDAADFVSTTGPPWFARPAPPLAPLDLGPIPSTFCTVAAAPATPLFLSPSLGLSLSCLGATGGTCPRCCCNLPGPVSALFSNANGSTLCSAGGVSLPFRFISFSLARLSALLEPLLTSGTATAFPFWFLSGWDFCARMCSISGVVVGFSYASTTGIGTDIGSFAGTGAGALTSSGAGSAGVSPSAVGSAAGGAVPLREATKAVKSGSDSIVF